MSRLLSYGPCTSNKYFKKRHASIAKNNVYSLKQKQFSTKNYRSY